MIAESEMLDRFEQVTRQRDNDWLVSCPAHADRTPSLHLTLGDDRWLLHCLAGCDWADVLSAARLNAIDLFADNGNGRREIVEIYPYPDEAGELLFQVVRRAPKDFRQRKPDGAGGWVWTLGDTRRVLYRLPQVIKANESGEMIYVVEGEKDVHALERVGVVASTSPGGAGKWREEYSESLRGGDVVIVADSDDPGRAHANAVAKSLTGIAASVRIVEPAVGKDVSDHLAAGKTTDDLVEAESTDDPDPDPANVLLGERVATAGLLDEVKTFLCRFVVLPSGAAADLLALWVLHTHAVMAFWATPYLRVTSAAPDSGKTLLLEILAAICRRGWHAVNPSSAVLYRKVDRDTPTLLLDELDNFPLDDRRDALGILNTGYKRGATVDRCKENGDLQSFAAYCPKAYAGLDDRSIVPALLSRSITIRMEKKVSSERVDMWIAPLVEPDAIRLRQRCEAWGDQHVEALTDHEPDLLGLFNRAAEVWWPLLAIAEVAGADWHARAQVAVEEFATGGDDTDDVSAQVQILLDIRDAFGDEQTLFTETLLAHLNRLDESPWGARRKGEGLDARGLARMLRPFKVRPKKVRVGDRTLQGYHVDQFDDAFARHLPEVEQAEQAEHPAPRLERNVPDVPDVPDFEAPADGGDARNETLGAAWDRLNRERARATA